MKRIPILCYNDGASECFIHPNPCPSISIKEINKSGICDFYSCQTVEDGGGAYHFEKIFRFSTPFSEMTGILYRNDGFSGNCSCAAYSYNFGQVKNLQDVSAEIILSMLNVYPNWTYNMSLSFDITTVSVPSCPSETWDRDTETVSFEFQLTPDSGDVDRLQCQSSGIEASIGVDETGNVVVGKSWSPTWFINKYGSNITIENAQLKLLGAC